MQRVLAFREREEERRHDVGIELRRGMTLQLGQRVFDRHSGAVRAVADHRVEGVAHGDDARSQRDLVPRQTVRIAGTVVALVVPPDEIGGVRE